MQSLLYSSGPCVRIERLRNHSGRNRMKLGPARPVVSHLHTGAKIPGTEVVGGIEWTPKPAGQ